MKCLNFTEYINLLCRQPAAVADVMGSSNYPDIRGTVRFFSAEKGTLVAVR